MDIQVDQLSVYNDGYIVSAKCNSRILDALIDDIHDFIESDFGILLAQQPPPVRLYESQVVIQMDGDIEKALNLFNELFKDMSDYSRTYLGVPGEYHFAGFHVSTDIVAHVAKKPPVFMLARRDGVDFSANYWWGNAGLRTDDHIAVLERLEKRLLA
ncbi:hypothetical protein KRR38_29380 [Novosphingobium sp. G106]|nr:hypothetical protein [Novosphingobium sp. G106]